MMGHWRYETRSRRRMTWIRRLRRWYLIGTFLVALSVAIDPEWPVHLRQFLVAVVTLLRALSGALNKYAP